MNYDSTIARMAADIASGVLTRGLDPAVMSEDDAPTLIVQESVRLARLIIAEVIRTAPPQAK